uniref:Cytosolic carboxypeptidase N-terminal domain-containing protein n=1 Tax=Anas platyrhynchos platyrhynchos TaxID=8840 RepID=A0A493TIH6_ANAPP
MCYVINILQLFFTVFFFFFQCLCFISAFTATGSDIGGDDIIAGNVSKYTVLPAGYCGQPKKGHLIFDACFESGNLGRVDHITEFEYDLFIRPDTCNPRFRVWFNFTVENVKESQVLNLSRPLIISLVSQGNKAYMIILSMLHLLA